MPLWALFIVVSACSSAYVKQIGGDIDHQYSKTFIGNYEVVWESVQDALKSERIEAVNKDTGYIQTGWADNTAAMNLAESYMGSHAFVKSEYRMKINLAKMFHQGVPAVRVSVHKDQLIQQDVLETPRIVETNGVDENTFLYRIGRLIVMKNKMDAEEKEQKEAELKNAASEEEFAAPKKKVN